MTTSHVSKSARKAQGTGALLPLIILAVMVTCFATVLGAARAEVARSVDGFVRNAAVGNEFEIESSRLALQKSQNDDVRNFAQRMINDHTKAGDDLRSAVAASDAGLAPPDVALDAKHQKIMDRLNAASGADFDAQYVKAQVAAHDEAVSLFQSYADHGRDQAVRRFAAQTLPTLQDHQKDIHQLSASI